MIDFNALAVFVAVVEAGSFTGGAVSLGLPKGSVSRKISGLEAELGVRLLQRTTRKLALTDVGRAYYERCKRGLVELDAANQVVQELQQVPMGVLRISAPADSGGGPFTDWVAAFLRRYPQTRVELVLSDQYVDLIEQRIDVAIRTGKIQDSAFIARKLWTSGRQLYASPDYVARHGSPAAVDDLRAYDCIVHAGSVDGAVWRLQGPEGEASVAIRARLAGNSMQFVRRAAVSGLGIALLPEVMARADVTAGALCPILEAYATADQGVFAVYPSRRQLSPNVRAFLDLLIDEAQRGAPWRTERA